MTLKLSLRTVFAMTAASMMLMADHQASAAEDAEQGFVQLFDGKTLDGWKGSTKGYQAKDGVLVCPKKGGGQLWTNKKFGDFVLRFEFKLTPGANNGLGIRAPGRGDPAYTGMELQILDNTANKYAKLKPYQYHGSIYGVVAAKRGHLKPVGEWNVQEVTAKGDQIKVVLNGQTIVDANIREASKDGTADHKKHPGLLNKTGHIGFLGHGSHVEFRNIRVKED
jgi:hypothetical protein